jgi:hypothetical protein
MSHNEPLHREPPIAMGCADEQRPRCTRCDDGFMHARRFADTFACEPCIRSGMCKVCREAWAADGWDECSACTESFYRANPLEFDDAIDVLRRSEHGRDMIRRISGNVPALFLARASTEASRRGDLDEAGTLLVSALRQRGRAA